ncbi:MAG: hypothetical protein N2248_00380 [candidate division WOR-3 bacterium]|nr:hypothetical protein [candidate division WOR-3 bacterium]
MLKKSFYTPSQLQALESFRTALINRGEYRQRFVSRPLALFEQFGHKFPPKIKNIFQSAYNCKYKTIVVVAPRGGGKTFIAADIAFAVFYLKDWNVLIIGGSKEQSELVTAYIGEFLENPDISQFAEDENRLLISGASGNWIRACAASRRAIRGKHSQGRPILLIMDEMGEMSDDIIRSALGTITDAPQSLILCLSTYHQVQGRFAEMVDEPDRFGAHLIQYDSFDVIARCSTPCSKCFSHWTTLRPELRDRYTREFKDIYCRGRAHKGTGWIQPDEIRAARVSNFIKEWFEVENMGARPAGEGSVIPPDRIRSAYSYDDLPYNPNADHFICIDWGMGMTAVNLLQFDGEYIDHLVSMEFSGITLRLIEEHLERLAAEYSTRLIYADSSHAFENQQLAEDGFTVFPVPFAQFKETGAGWLKYLFEEGKWRGLKKFELCISQLLKWRRDASGKIIKKDDHHPDSLLAGTAHFNRPAGGIASLGAITFPDETPVDIFLTDSEKYLTPIEEL